MAQVEFRKAAKGVKSYVDYTADKPASWDVVVDGEVRGLIKGRVHQYSSERTFVLVAQGVEVSRHSRLKDARRAAVAYAWSVAA